MSQSQPLDQKFVTGSRAPVILFGAGKTVGATMRGCKFRMNSLTEENARSVEELLQSMLDRDILMSQAGKISAGKDFQNIGLHGEKAS